MGNLESKNKIHLSKCIQEMKLKHLFENRRVILFGANDISRYILKILYENEIEVEAFIDNNTKITNNKILGKNIYLPETLLSEFDKKFIILIASQYYKEMCAQLKRMGYKKNIHVFKMLDVETTKVQLRTGIFNFLKNSKRVFEGLSIYIKFRKKYGWDRPIYLYSFKGIGDMYLANLYMKEHLKMLKNNDCIMVVTENACLKIGRMFELKNMCKITEKEAEAIQLLGMFVGIDTLNIKPMHYWAFHTDFLRIMEGYKGLTYLDMLKYNILEVEENAIIELPKVRYRKEYIEKMFEEKGLKKNKTVILSPYANSICSLKKEAWEKLVDGLVEKGYTVCTNSSGEKEPAINKTVPIFFDFEDANSVLEYAGIFIGIRSGFCDVISTAKCKKIVIYPKYKYGAGECSILEFFSLKSMNISNDADEIEFNSRCNLECTLEFSLECDSNCVFADSHDIVQNVMERLEVVG